MTQLPWRLSGVFACALLLEPGVKAQSQVTVYGVAAVELLHLSGVANGGVVSRMNKLDNSQVTTSRLGFRGSEDLGGGASAIFGLEAPIALDTGAQANAARFYNRGSYVGLRSEALGTITAGRLWGVNDDIMGRYFNFGGYSIFRYTEFSHISNLTDNALKYATPEFGGVQARAMLAAGEGVTGRTAEVGVNYKGSPFEAAATYRNAKGLNGRSDTLSTVAASLTLGPVRLRGGVSAADPAGSSLPKARAYAAGAVWTFDAPWVATVDYVLRDQRGTDNDSRFLRLGADYFLSKRSSLFVVLVALKNKGTAKERFYGDGAAGVNQNVSSFGVRHLF